MNYSGIEQRKEARQEQCPKCEGWKYYTSKESGKTYICSYCRGTGIVWRKPPEKVGIGE